MLRPAVTPGRHECMPTMLWADLHVFEKWPAGYKICTCYAGKGGGDHLSIPAYPDGCLPVQQNSLYFSVWFIILDFFSQLTVFSEIHVIVAEWARWNDMPPIGCVSF